MTADFKNLLGGTSVAHRRVVPAQEPTSSFPRAPAIRGQSGPIPGGTARTPTNLRASRTRAGRAGMGKVIVRRAKVASGRRGRGGGGGRRRGGRRRGGARAGVVAWTPYSTRPRRVLPRGDRRGAARAAVHVPRRGAARRGEAPRGGDGGGEGADQGGEVRRADDAHPDEHPGGRRRRRRDLGGPR